MENHPTPERIAQVETAFICRVFEQDRDLIALALKELGPFHRKAIIYSIQRIINAANQSEQGPQKEGAELGGKGQSTDQNS
jgi:hypothetical protein